MVNLASVLLNWSNTSAIESAEQKIISLNYFLDYIRNILVPLRTVRNRQTQNFGVLYCVQMFAIDVNSWKAHSRSANKYRVPYNIVYTIITSYTI